MLWTRLFFVVVVLLLSQAVREQTEPPKKPEPYKFAEFGAINKADLQNKMDAFYSRLRNQENSQGFIIN